jgi:4-amino-4-deoxy-L-arabinose transferase-like glycosyltransferase
MPDSECTAGSPADRRRRLVCSPWPPAVAVALLALAVFGFRLKGEPHFVDESAYLSQSYYAALYFEGRHHDRAWLEYPAYDLPPLPKYLIGAALAAGGYPTPGPSAAFAWYRNTSLRFVSAEALAIARLPVVLLGVVGCAAVYGIGTLAGGRAVGVLAAVLLAVNPLYRMLARRAMSDVPCEAFMLLALFLGLWTWRRWVSGRGAGRVWAAIGAAGLCVGLALLCKLSGALALMVLAGWAVLGAVLRGRVVSAVGSGLAGLLAVVAACGTFVVLDPFLTAHPPPPLPPALAALDRAWLGERARLRAELRVKVASGQQEMFPHNALHTPLDKAATTAVQGFGRFGPLGPAHSDSTRRYDLAQDWGALLWLPCVVAGLAVAVAQGRAQRAAGEPPTSWAVAVQFIIVLVVVTAYLPLAWDRYFLSMQAPASLLAAGAAVAGARRLTRFRAHSAAGG